VTTGVTAVGTTTGSSFVGAAVAWPSAAPQSMQNR